MSAEHAFQTLKTFFETREAARLALSTLSTNVEIGIVIADFFECALFRDANGPVVEQRPARNPDVVFYIRPETVYVLADRTKDEISDIGVNIFKEILTGNITVKVPGSLLNIARHGYLDMLKLGGAPVTAIVARLSATPLSSGFVPRIMSMIRQLKR